MPASQRRGIKAKDIAQQVQYTPHNVIYAPNTFSVAEKNVGSALYLHQPKGFPSSIGQCNFHEVQTCGLFKREL